MKTTMPHRADDVARAQQLGEWLGGVALAASRRLRGAIGSHRAFAVARASHAQQALPQRGRSGQLV